VDEPIKPLARYSNHVHILEFFFAWISFWIACKIDCALQSSFTEIFIQGERKERLIEMWNSTKDKIYSLREGTKPGTKCIGFVLVNELYVSYYECIRELDA